MRIVGRAEQTPTIAGQGAGMRIAGRAERTMPTIAGLRATTVGPAEHAMPTTEGLEATIEGLEEPTGTSRQEAGK